MPAESAVAGAVVPAGDLVIEDVGGEREPRGLVGGDGKCAFGGSHGGEAPDGLVVVALGSMVRISIGCRWGRPELTSVFV